MGDSTARTCLIRLGFELYSLRRPKAPTLVGDSFSHLVNSFAVIFSPYHAAAVSGNVHLRLPHDLLSETSGARY
jgi:hypothetical protein